MDLGGDTDLAVGDVGRDLNELRFRHGGDLFGLEDAAAAHHVGHDHIHRLRRNEVAEAEAGIAALADADGDVDCGLDLGQRVDVFGPDRLLVEDQANLFAAVAAAGRGAAAARR